MPSAKTFWNQCCRWRKTAYQVHKLGQKGYKRSIASLYANPHFGLPNFLPWFSFQLISGNAGGQVPKRFHLVYLSDWAYWFKGKEDAVVAKYGCWSNDTVNSRRFLLLNASAQWQETPNSCWFLQYEEIAGGALVEFIRFIACTSINLRLSCCQYLVESHHNCCYTFHLSF